MSSFGGAPVKAIAAFSLLLFSSQIWAQNETPPTPPLAKTEVKAAVGEQSFKITYGSTSWNLDSSQPDSAYLFLRDRKTGKIVKIQLEETEPDSSIFSGSFAVSWGQGATVDPEVYIPPKDLRNNEMALKKFNTLLSQNAIKSQPMVIQAGEKGLRTIDVYDTADQAARAKQAADAAEKAKQAAEKTELVKPALKPQDLEVAKNAAQQALLKKLADEAAKRETDRIRLEQIERQRNLELERQAQALSEQQRMERKARAQTLADEAMAEYTQGNFASAESKFKQATELDPENKSYYFRYGVTLYRNEKFNEALVVMKLSPENPETSLERKYYMGLIHMRLKELDPALAYMKEVGAQKKSPLAPSGAFYEGVILFAKEDFEAAKEPFERVIDISNDPRLDEQAERYLDQLVSLIAQKKAMSKRYFINGMVGATYDSNVLLAPDTETAQGSATKEGDFRALLAGDFEYRPIFTKMHEWGAKAQLYYLRSSKDDVSRADPFQFNLGVPYTYKGNALGKGYKFALKPSAEIVFMDVNQDGTREGILQSYIIGADNTFVMKPDYLATYSAEIRYDDSLTPDSVGDANSDALKYTLKTAHTFLLDKAAKEALVASAGLVMNAAKGKDKYYQRYELGATYVRPTSWQSTWSVGLSYYWLDFSKGADHRSDKNLTLSSGVIKPIKEWVSWTLNGSYSSNASNVEANHYSKFTVTAAAIFNYSL